MCRPFVLSTICVHLWQAMMMTSNRAKQRATIFILCGRCGECNKATLHRFSFVGGAASLTKKSIYQVPAKFFLLMELLQVQADLDKMTKKTRTSSRTSEAKDGKGYPCVLSAHWWPMERVCAHLIRFESTVLAFDESLRFLAALATRTSSFLWCLCIVLVVCSYSRPLCSGIQDWFCASAVCWR